VRAADCDIARSALRPILPIHLRNLNIKQDLAKSLCIHILHTYSKHHKHKKNAKKFDFFDTLEYPVNAMANGTVTYRQLIYNRIENS